MVNISNTQFMTGSASLAGVSRQKQGASIEGTSFGDVLAGLMNNGEIEEKTQKLDPVESFRNIVKSKIEHVDLDKMAETKKKVDAALDWLSKYLGIPKGLLISVMKELNIDPNDMADPMKLAEIIKKIVGKFGLDQKQEDEITRELNGIFGFAG